MATFRGSRVVKTEVVGKDDMYVAVIIITEHESCRFFSHDGQPLVCDIQPRSHVGMAFRAAEEKQKKQLD